MRAQSSVLLLAAITLVGCDRITGAADQKIYDAEAIGYACRLSYKPPEDCMKENESQSPTSILSGWKAADKAIKEGIVDPAMGRHQAAPQPVAPAVAAQSEVKPAEPAAASKVESASAPKAAPEAKKTAVAPNGTKAPR
ncbi:hypothetical protein FGKAn22_03040 [Ferrigenium kumadai]|uniref:Uncharacterized protein n=1 Tax=Ferrigenium kumadai TaxID=1682490 RepID=A0AAN1SXW7_9PROT|nr:hypothetical protein [Ferrigenium kumadai]BBI98611.1 hypothetical protein FGKAn22_03040 [Ferrigenium kumadai]